MIVEKRGGSALIHVLPWQIVHIRRDDTLFLFCGRRSDRIKGLYWDNNGFILLYKRLEKGTFHWPRDKQEALRITAQQYEWLCMGFEIEARNKPVNTAGLRFS